MVIIKLIVLIIFIFFSNQSYPAQNFQIIRDAEIELYLHKIIKSTIGETKSKNFHPRLVLNSEYNAFVTGSNKVYINTGLINKSNSLSEIQAVMAHEIGHLTLNHYNSRLVNSKELSKYSKLATFAGIALSAQGKLDANSAFGLMIGSNDLATKSLLQFSRIQEQQADKFALKQLINNKISLIGLEKLLTKLANEELNNSNTPKNYYRSHPFSKQRLQQVKKYKLQYQKVSLGEQKISLNKNIISLQYIKNKIKAYSDDPNKLMKNLENKNDFLSNYLQMVALYRLGKYDLAHNKLSLIEKKYSEYPFFYEFRGDIYFKEGNYNNAISQYEKAIDILENLKILPYEHAGEGRELYEKAYFNSAINKINDGRIDEAIKLIIKSKLWPEELGVGKPYKPDERIQNFLLYICYKKLGRPNYTFFLEEVVNYSKENIDKLNLNYILGYEAIKESKGEELANKFIDQIKQVRKNNLSEVEWLIKYSKTQSLPSEKKFDMIRSILKLK